MSLTPALAQRLDDPKAEVVRANMEQQIRELQTIPGAELAVVVRDQVIPGTTVNNAVVIPHRLGRAPRFVWVSAPRVARADLASLTAGMIMDLGSFDTVGNPIDRTQFVKIGGFGFTVNVIVDVAVF